MMNRNTWTGWESSAAVSAEAPDTLWRQSPSAAQGIFLRRLAAAALTLWIYVNTLDKKSRKIMLFF